MAHRQPCASPDNRRRVIIMSCAHIVASLSKGWQAFVKTSFDTDVSVSGPVLGHAHPSRSAWPPNLQLESPHAASSTDASKRQGPCRTHYSSPKACTSSTDGAEEVEASNESCAVCCELCNICTHGKDVPSLYVRVRISKRTPLDVAKGGGKGISTSYPRETKRHPRLRDMIPINTTV